MSLKQKEIAISKATSVMIDNDHIAIIAHLYHTADKKTNPDDKSWYKYVGRVERVSDLQAEITSLEDPANRLNLWKWPCPAWPDDWFIGYDKSNTNSKAARWLEQRIKKAISWEAYEKLVKYGIKRIAKFNTERQYPSAAYEVDDYVDVNGQTFSILDSNALLAHVKIPFWKDCVLKRDLPK